MGFAVIDHQVTVSIESLDDLFVSRDASSNQAERRDDLFGFEIIDELETLTIRHRPIIKTENDRFWREIDLFWP